MQPPYLLHPQRSPLSCHPCSAGTHPATLTVQPPRLPRLQRSPLGCHHCSAALWAATPSVQPLVQQMAATRVVGHPRLPQLACSLSAALTALQPQWLPPLQCSLPADTIAAQHHWRSSLPCPPTCGAASWLPHHCSTASFPLTPRTSPVAPGVGYWSRSRRGHHRAAHGASPGLVLPNLCIAAENFAALSPPSGSSSTYPPPALAPPTEKNPAASASESVYCSVSS